MLAWAVNVYVVHSPWVPSLVRLQVDILKVTIYIYQRFSRLFTQISNCLQLVKNWRNFYFRQKSINISTTLSYYEIPKTLRQFVLNKMDVCSVVPCLTEVGNCFAKIPWTSYNSVLLGQLYFSFM